MKPGSVQIRDKHTARIVPGEQDYDGIKLKGGGYLGYWGMHGVGSIEHEMRKFERKCSNSVRHSRQVVNRALAGLIDNG